MSADERRPIVRILAWYDSEGRHGLPWRDPDASAFEVLVAELMLQRTSVEQVIPVYPEFVERYPTPDAVVRADESDLAGRVRPLGLAKRVEYLKRASERIVGEYDGRVPSDRSELLELRGVGEYTARSVLAHAHGEDVPAVDTNVARILSRLHDLDAEADDLRERAEHLSPEGRGSDFTHALIDFGAKVCTAANPKCADCFVRDACEYYAEERDE